MLHALSKPAVSKYIDNHSAVEAVDDKDLGVRGYIAIHRGSKSRPAFGATRLWFYENNDDALREVLQLSRLMSYKAALAGLPYGGGKAVLIADPKSIKDRGVFFQRYAEFVNQFDGSFVTGADVGVSQEDVNSMKIGSNYIVGTQRDPVYFTTLGIESAVRSVYQLVVENVTHAANKNQKNLSIAIQGLGKIGMGLLERVYDPKNTIYVADPDLEKVVLAQSRFPGVRAVDPSQIHKQKVAIFAPCAMSHAINKFTVGELNCAAVVGGANNQLQSLEMAIALFEQGIMYAPDYVVNAGGIMSVVDEYEYGDFPSVGLESKVTGIGRVLEAIIEESQSEKKSPQIIADKKAQEIISKYE